MSRVRSHRKEKAIGARVRIPQGLRERIPQIADLLLQALDGHGTERNISAMMGMTIIIGMVTGIAIFYSRNSTWERGRMSGR